MAATTISESEHVLEAAVVVEVQVGEDRPAEVCGFEPERAQRGPISSSGVIRLRRLRR